jgi:hypothetical protein
VTEQHRIESAGIVPCGGIPAEVSASARRHGGTRIIVVIGAAAFRIKLEVSTLRVISVVVIRMRISACAMVHVRLTIVPIVATMVIRRRAELPIRMFVIVAAAVVVIV